MISVPFHIPGFTVGAVKEEATHIRIDVNAQASQAACPRCHHPSTSIHSCYQRSPQDLPISGKNVRLVLHVRRFRCRNHLCEQQTFAEPLPGFLLKHARANR